MGAVLSRGTRERMLSPRMNALKRAPTQWKVINTKKDILKEAEIDKMNDDEVALRIILSEPVGQKHIGNFAKLKFTSETFYCWVEIHEFRNAPSFGFRKCLALHIYEKYIRKGAKMALGSLSYELIQRYDADIAAAKMNTGLLHRDFFKSVQRLCQQDMCHNTYVPFKASAQYQVYKDELKEAYNKVAVDDFDYLDTLGAGGFGRVVHARKKSTGHHYAMKIQLKTGLLDEHRGDLSKLASEKVIFQACNHPYIVDMHYSFQTDQYAIIVLALVRGGDLCKLIRSFENPCIPEEIVGLYAAEVALALNHLHEMGLLYRDLKPANVLLTASGHCKLADMGLAGGVHLSDPERLEEKNEELVHEEEELEQFMKEQASHPYVLPEETIDSPCPDSISPASSPAPTSSKSIQAISISATPTASSLSMRFTRVTTAHRLRRKTTVGTRGYMAPEMLRGKLKRRADRTGYNNSVDYWSYGVMIYELMVGKLPFPRKKRRAPEVISNDPFAPEQILEPVDPRQEVIDELAQMEMKVFFPDHVSADAADFITRLLDVNEETRLGCTDAGFARLMAHPFFKNIDWDKLIVNHVEADFKPFVKPLNDKQKTHKFDEIMAKFDAKERDCRHDWYETPASDQQCHFDTWDYISPYTLKSELGIANEMDESNVPYKVQQITGESGKSKR